MYNRLLYKKKADKYICRCGSCYTHKPDNLGHCSTSSDINARNILVKTYILSLILLYSYETIYSGERIMLNIIQEAVK